MGARNYPAYGSKGNDVLREQYDKQLIRLGAVVEEGGIIVDLGCGTGVTSTACLARLYPQASRVIGLDLSPYMVAVGRHLLERGPSIAIDNSPPYQRDPRISIDWANLADTGLGDSSVSLVSLCLVLHELPRGETLLALREAFRMLKPGGTLAITEMDPSAPGYVKLRQTPWLFSILRSTEPYLDEYFELASELPMLLQDAGFQTVRIGAATGRHFTTVALKGGVADMRPPADVREKSDQHLKTFKVK